ncbi:hypothetical protein QF027_006547 [Streptomyces canus]|nr:hypothetical protein [Streptomyces canus]
MGLRPGAAGGPGRERRPGGPARPGDRDAVAQGFAVRKEAVGKRITARIALTDEPISSPAARRL